MTTKELKEMLKDVKNPKNAYNELTAKDPMFWVKFVRRYKANYFDVHFHDKETISDEDIYETIKRVAEFFELPMPIISERSETLEEVVTSEQAEGTELYYNAQMMYKAGINNYCTLTLAFVHEFHNIQ